MMARDATTTIDYMRIGRTVAWLTVIVELDEAEYHPTTNGATGGVFDKAEIIAHARACEHPPCPIGEWQWDWATLTLEDEVQLIRVHPNGPMVPSRRRVRVTLRVLGQ
jgi:hypothetical protein